MNLRRRLDPKNVRPVIGSAVAIAALLTAGILAAGALAKKPSGPGPTTTTVPTSGKVTICHHTHSLTNPGVTITIDVHAWKAHQRHGDTLGPCLTTTTTTTTASTPESTTTTESAVHGNSGNAPGNSGNAPGHSKK